MLDLDKYIYTNRLMLRQFQEIDITEYIKIMTNPLVTQYLGDRKNKTKTDIINLLSKFDKVWGNNNYGVWAVLVKETNQLIGHCGFLPVEKSSEIELLYAFNSDVWGNGYATEAALAVIEHARAYYEWTTIIAMAYPENKASIHVIEKIGFKFKEVIEIFESELNVYIYNLRK